jgi:tetratricopeptide (TPR) repeat protein
VSLAAYSNSFRGLLVFDEQPSLVDNPYVRSLASALHAPPDSTLAGRPVASLTFAINYALAPAEGRETFAPARGGSAETRALVYRNLWGYHAVNLAIHVLAALVLFGVLRRTLAGPRLGRRFGDAATPLALATALIWVAHPLQTASVTYVMQRVESLMGLFYLLTLYCSIRAWDTASASATRTSRERAWMVAAVACCAAGMGSKEVMVSAPLIIVLYDVVFRRTDSTDEQPAGGRLELMRVWRRRWPFYAALALTWVFLAVLVLSGPRPKSVGIGLGGWSSWLYLKTQATVIVHYIRLVLVPWPLSIDYEWPAATSVLRVLPQALLLICVCGLTTWGLVRAKPVAFLGAWFFLILAPSSSILPIATEIAAEHRMYLPLAAAAALLVAGGWILVRRLAGPGRIGVVLGIVLSGTAVVAGGCLTHQRNGDYQSEDGLWARTVARQPWNPRARSNYGWALLRQQRFPAAESQLRVALALQPDDPEAHLNLGIALCSQGRTPEGLEHLERAVALSPKNRDANYNLGEALTTVGRDTEALRAYRRALDAGPRDLLVLKRIVRVMATAPEDTVRDGKGAIPLAEEAVRLARGNDVDSLDLLAAAYAEAGRYTDAAETAQTAERLAARLGRPDLAEAVGVRLALYRSGRPFHQAPHTAPIR